MTNKIIGALFFIVGIFFVLIPHSNYLDGKELKKIITLLSYPFLFAYAVILFGVINIYLEESFSRNVALYGFGACFMHYYFLKSRKKDVW